MPIESSQVTQLIQQQNAAFAQANAYAAQIGQRAQMTPGINTLSGQINAGSTLSAGIIGGVEAAGGAAMLAAGFGYGPPVLESFTGVVDAAKWGHKAGGMSTAIGAGIGAASAYFAVGAIASKITEQVMVGSQQQAAMSGMLQQIYRPSGLANSMGGLTAGTMHGISNTVFSASGNGQGSLGDLSGVLQGGMATGAFNGATNISEFRKKFSDLVSNVKEVATAMKTSMGEAQAVMGELAGIGVPHHAAGGFVANLRGGGMASGLSPAQSMEYARMGSQTFRSMGLSGGMGAGVYARNANIMGYMGKSGQIDSGRFGDMGGTASSARFTTGNLRMLNSRRGLKVIGAAMGADGELDADIVTQINSGTLNKKQIAKLYASNINSGEARADLRSRQSELAGQFVESAGPGGLSGTLEAMFGGSKQADYLKQAFSGTSRADLKVLDKLAAAGPQIKLKLEQEMKRAMQMASSGADGDVSSLVNKVIDDFTRPAFSKMQKVGRTFHQSVTEWASSMSHGISGRPKELNTTGGWAGQEMLYARGGTPIYGTGGGSSLSVSMTPQGFGGVPQFVDALRQGDRLSDYPMGGMLPRGDATGVAIVAGAGLAAGFAGGNELGRGIQGYGARNFKLKGAADAGFWRKNMGGAGRLLARGGTSTLGGAIRGSTGKMGKIIMAGTMLYAASGLLSTGEGIYGKKAAALRTAAELGVIDLDKHYKLGSSDGFTNVGDDGDMSINAEGIDKFFSTPLHIGDDLDLSVARNTIGANRLSLQSGSFSERAKRLAGMIEKRSGSRPSDLSAAAALNKYDGQGREYLNAQTGFISPSFDTDEYDATRAEKLGDLYGLDEDSARGMYDEINSIADKHSDVDSFMHSKEYAKLVRSIGRNNQGELSKYGISTTSIIPRVREFKARMGKVASWHMSRPWGAKDLFDAAQERKHTFARRDRAVANVTLREASLGFKGNIGDILRRGGAASRGLGDAITDELDDMGSMHYSGSYSSTVTKELAKLNADQSLGVAKQFAREGDDFSSRIASFAYGVSEANRRLTHHKGRSTQDRMGYIAEFGKNNPILGSLLRKLTKKERSDMFSAGGTLNPSIVDALVTARETALLDQHMSLDEAKSVSRRDVRQIEANALDKDGITVSDIKQDSAILGLDNALSIGGRTVRPGEFNKITKDVIDSLEALRIKINTVAGKSEDGAEVK